jgi:hypothetical protein
LPDLFRVYRSLTFGLVGSRRLRRGRLRPGGDDGTWLLVEPASGDRLEDDLNPVGRLYDGFSVLLCVPNALPQQPTAVLGNQAGEARTRELVAAGGFSRFRRAAETPLNLVSEARP